MPRYFFNLRYGPGPNKLAVDPEGDDLSGLDAAAGYALLSARDLIARTLSHGVRDWFACSFEIEDADRRPLLTVPFGNTVGHADDEDRADAALQGGLPTWNAP